MKHRLFCLFLIVALCLAPCGATAAPVTPALFRLQVVANSDSPKDQALKLCVRNEIIQLAQALFADIGSAQEACDRAMRYRHRFQTAAQQVAGDETVRVEVGEFDFPERIYSGVRVPAGRYNALKVTLGRGEGHNWWCVLYPTLCGVDESSIGEDGRITFYSQTLQWLRSLFGGQEK